jgi:hypothetical protein
VVAIGAGLASLLLLVPHRGNPLARWRGIVLVAIAAAYAVATIALGSA